METRKKKKGFLATIWESMTKTGGCCGPGESCCVSSDKNEKKKDDEGKRKQESCN